MYTVVVFAIMLVFPILSILIEQALSQHGYMEAVIVGKWFVFWLVGVRLLLAGIRQILQPNYTAEKLLGIKDPASYLVVRELGFANSSIGTLGVVSLFNPAWVVPAAIAGCLFYTLAAINHALRPHRNHHENIAMWTDFMAAAMLLIILVHTYFTREA